MTLKMRHNLPAILTILTFASLALVSGCSTAKPTLENVIVRDTVVVTETKYLLDTLEVFKDTVIYQDKIRVQLQYVDRKVVVEATTQPDTIRINTVKIVTKEAEQRQDSPNKLLFTFLFIAVFLMLVKKWVDYITK
jgi:hypothetical protein